VTEVLVRGVPRVLDRLVKDFADGLAGRSAAFTDPVALARRAGIEPDAWQAEVLRSPERQLALLCARQTGKSLTAALKVVHTAATEPGALVLLVAPALRQASELFAKVRKLVAALSELAVVRETALTLTLGNRSRIVVIPGMERTVRGFSAVRLIVIDEAARVPDDLYQSLRPMLAVSGGTIVLLSTPWGRRGFLHHEWTEGGPDWHRVKVTADQCPRMDPRWLRAERQRIGDWWFKQEYGCEFVATTDSVFTPDLIEGIFSDRLRPFLDAAPLSEGTLPALLTARVRAFPFAVEQ
jgi:hypothetical protein